MLKRLLSTIVGIAILVFVTISNNSLVFSVAVSIVAMIGLNEFYNAMKKINLKPIEWIGYLVTVGLIAIPLLSVNALRVVLISLFPFILFVTFLISILSNMKRNVVDAAVTIFGILYVTYLIAFLILTRQMENGVFYVWFIFCGAWFTDTFAFIFGTVSRKTLWQPQVF